MFKKLIERFYQYISIYNDNDKYKKQFIFAMHM